MNGLSDFAVEGYGAHPSQRSTVKHLGMSLLLLGFMIAGLCLPGCNDDNAPSQFDDQPLHPECYKTEPLPSDDNTPETVVSDWSQPVRLGDPINNACPQDAIEISSDGQYLYFMFTADVTDSMTPEELLSAENNT